MDKNMSLDDYRKLVEQVMRETLSSPADATPRVFTNIGKEHASIVIGTMLDYAQSDVCTYTDKLSREVWDPAKILGFLQRSPNAKVRVLVDCVGAAKKTESSLSVLGEAISEGRIEVRQAKNNRLQAHMCITDQRHIRLEQDAQSRKAVVSFGDSELGLAAIKTFDRCWELNA